MKLPTRQKQELLSNFCLRKKKNKYVITDIDTFRNASKKEQQNITLMVSSFTVVFNNTFAFFVGLCKLLNSCENILKRAKYVRKIKIPEEYLKELKKDFPNFSLTYLYKYQCINGRPDKWSIDDIFGPQKNT